LLGPQFPDADIEMAFAGKNLRIQKIENASCVAADLLAQGKVIGWYQGRMEFGQRALGARSILADPRKAEMKEIINAKVKFREFFRPFAPAVLEERASEFFIYPKPIPFMTEVCPVREEKKSIIPAVTHVDGTARVQTVSKKANAPFYDLIRRFGELTGVPVVLNTSFNVKGDPIVNTPEQAVNTFLKTDIDALVAGNFLVQKKL
jgi:carbamoyltransferase